MPTGSNPPPPPTPVARLAVIGVGLIGSSVLRAARARAAARELVCWDPDPQVRDRAEALGLADRVATDAGTAAAGADLVLLAAPPLALAALAAEVGRRLEPGAVLTDVGSVKGGLFEAFSEAAPQAFAVPGHPIAGTEQSGPDAGFPSLFEGRWTILCPGERDDAGYLAAVDRLASFWRALGARVETMDARRHDLVLAVTSHLPHLIAYNIVGTAADLEAVTRSEVIKFSASGFRDFTRIAASDPTMWRDIFLMNRDAVLEILGRFTEDLQALSRSIRWGEGDRLFELFSRTREIRRGVIAAGQESPLPNFGRDRRE